MQFNNLLLHSCQWDVNCLEELLHREVVHHVIGILPPALDDSNDAAVWRCTPTDIFTIASVYARDLEPLWEDVDSKWSHLRSLPVTIAWAAYFVDICVSTRPRSTPTIVYHQWKKPAPGWLCLNTDASISTPDGVRTIGGALRDSFGAWIRDYCKCIGKASTIQAELWSIYVELQVTWSFGTVRLVIQSDSSQAIIKLVLDPSAMCHSMQLVRAIAAWRLKHWSLDFQWIPREMNMVVDCPSKMAPPQFQLNVFDDVPDPVRPLLIRDVEGPPYRCSCRDSHSVG
ncbi:hypothetical protein V6N12_071712 [Hibiscus sabdariffa]|uniref:RNase H type-1 domain-containing protein n=1 Tax=Hibiscus sabdariffa TaxID=183260 RepID=A0ABR2FKY5_9ROSI